MSDNFEQLVPDNSAIEEVYSEGSWLEGPCWVPSRGVLRFSDVIGNKILEFDPDSKSTSVYQTEVEHTNGRAIDIDGSVLQCSHGRRRIERDREGLVTSVVDNFLGHKFNAPNDIIVRSNGDIFFTDPAYGLVVPQEGHPGRREYGDHYVFVYTTSGELRPIIMDMVDPNGLAFSPDESLLYVADSSKLNNEGRFGRQHIRVYQVDGVRAKNGADFIELEGGVPDGIKVDEHGNIWTTCSDAWDKDNNSIQVYSPEGELLGSIYVPKRVGNITFGGADGKTLFIAASSSIYQIQTNVRDAKFEREEGYKNENRLWSMNW